MKPILLASRSLMASLVATAFCLSVSQAAVSDIVVVVNKDNPITSISQKEGKKIFLGVSHHFQHGAKIDLVDQKSNGELRGEFYSLLAEKTVSQINSRWAGLIFSGEAVPPDQVENSEDVIDWLERHPNGIGYIDSSFLDDRVKTILTLP